jgi:hypothetical protein
MAVADHRIPELDGLAGMEQENNMAGLGHPPLTGSPLRD